MEHEQSQLNVAELPGTPEVPSGLSLQIPRWHNSETQESKEFGKINVVEGTNTVGCVDPRQSLQFIVLEGELAEAMHTDTVRHPEHDAGAERSPGATAGKIMALMAANPEISVEQAVDLVFAWEVNEGRTPTLHGDDHGHGLGCGHVDKACQHDFEALYGIACEKVQAMRDYVKDKAHHGGEEVNVPILHDNHREQGVLVVLSDLENARTVEAIDDMGNEFFRFDKSRFDASLLSLAHFAYDQGIQVDIDKLKTAAEKQLTATLTLLARGLPVYTVDLREGKHEIGLQTNG